ncbi:MAG: protein kinase [Pseudomonadales bacterium]|nr:protein kinase [Pseudomonadales bacterium]
MQCSLGVVGYLLVLLSPEWQQGYALFVLLLTAFVIAASFLNSSGTAQQRTYTFGVALILSATAYAEGGLESLANRSEIAVLQFLAILKLEAMFPYYFWRFARRFPRSFIPRKLDVLLHLITAVSLVLGVALITINIVDYYAASLPIISVISDSNSNNLHEVLVYGIAFPALFLLLFKMRTARLDERRRVRVFILGLVVSIAPPLLFVITTSLSDAALRWATQPEIYVFIISLMQSFVIAIPVITTYAVLVERIMPVRILLKQSLRYSFGIGTVALIITFPVILFFYYLFQFRSQSIEAILDGPNGVFSLLAIALSIFLLSQRKRAYQYLDELFYRSKIDTGEALANLSRSVQDAGTIQDLIQATDHVLDSTLHPHCIHLLVVSDERIVEDPRSKLSQLSLNSEFGQQVLTMTRINKLGEVKESINESEAKWLVEAEVECIVPLRRQSGIVGLLLVGSKKSEMAYSSADLKFLELVGNNVSQFFENKDTVWFKGEEPDATNFCSSCGIILENTAVCKECGSSEAQRSLLPRYLHNRYELEKQIGIGGMAMVYLGSDLSLNRKVVLKTMLDTTTEEHAFLRSEARLMATLSHKNIAGIYAFELYRSMPILVCE